MFLTTPTVWELFLISYAVAIYDKPQGHVLMKKLYYFISGSDTVPADMESFVFIKSCVSKLSLVHRIT